MPGITLSTNLLCGRDDIIQTIANRFSDDGLWWWDGGRWVATSEVELPRLPATAFEQTGGLDNAHAGIRRRNQVSDVLVVATVPAQSPLGIVGLALTLPFLIQQHGLFRDYRTWTLEQLSLATEHVLGAGEPMLAGETELIPHWGGPVSRDLAVVVTAAHVIVFRIDPLLDQPRWVAMAASAGDVTIGKNPALATWPWLDVLRGPQRWRIRGYPWVFQPGPVIQAWRRAAGVRPR